MKVCKKCLIELTIKNHVKSNGNICRLCKRQNSMKRYKLNKKEILAAVKIYEQNNKNKVIEAYGGKCVCCGELEPIFLTIDHINNNGVNERATTNQGTGGKMYRWLIKNNFPKDNYQLLCYNCNCAKGFFGICPHKSKLNFS